MRRSTTGFIILMAGAAIAWLSKRQALVTLSTAEAEFVSATRCAQEISFLRMLLDYLGFTQTEPTVIFEDNAACVFLTEEPAHACRTKHIDLRCMYLKELKQRNVVKLVPVPTDKQHADFLTKSLSRELHQYHYQAINGSQYTPKPTQ